VTCIVQQLQSGGSILEGCSRSAGHYLIETARFPNFRQDRTQIKSPFEADPRLRLDKMKEQGVTMHGGHIIWRRVWVYILHKETDLEVNSGMDWKPVQLLAEVMAWCGRDVSQHLNSSRICDQIVVCDCSARPLWSCELRVRRGAQTHLPFAGFRWLPCNHTRTHTHTNTQTHTLTFRA